MVRNHSTRNRSNASTSMTGAASRQTPTRQSSNHRRPSGSRPRGSDPSRVKVATLDLRYSKEFTVTVNDGPSLSSLERYIRDRYEQGGKPLEDAAVFQFFDSKGRELFPSAKITTETATLWYRVARSRAHIGRWKLSHWEDRTDGALDDDNLAAKIISAIDTGATVRELKQAIAEHLNIRDWQRVLIVARDGMRRGTLQGNNWEVRQVKEWLCRWLAIDVNPHNGYVIFRGLGREYVWYPGAHRAGKSTPLVILWEYLLSRVFHNVHRYGRTKLKGGGGLELRLRGKVLDIWSDSVEWCATYDFELADGFAETFVAEEAWLTTVTEQCSTCIEDKKPGEMATRITSSCRHKPSVCKDCLQSWLETSVESGKWEKPKCPDCSEVLEWQDVKRHASKETFARYDDLLLRGALTAEPNFQYCLSQTCNSGQIYEGKCPRFKCAACKKAYCVEHNVPWHANETCEQYDQRNDKHRKAERASEREVQTTTKACPSCGKRVFKHSGCNHMTCKSCPCTSSPNLSLTPTPGICSHEWCYRCLAPYAYTAHGFLFCRHTAECTENDPVVPALDALNEFAAMRAGPMRAGEQAAARALPPHPRGPLPRAPAPRAHIPWDPPLNPLGMPTGQHRPPLRPLMANWAATAAAPRPPAQPQPQPQPQPPRPQGQAQPQPRPRTPPPPRAAPPRPHPPPQQHRQRQQQQQQLPRAGAAAAASGGRGAGGGTTGGAPFVPQRLRTTPLRDDRTQQQQTQQRQPQPQQERRGSVGGVSSSSSSRARLGENERRGPGPAPGPGPDPRVSGASVGAAGRTGVGDRRGGRGSRGRG